MTTDTDNLQSTPIHATDTQQPETENNHQQKHPTSISQQSITNTRDLPCLKLDGNEVKIDNY